MYESLMFHAYFIIKKLVVINLHTKIHNVLCVATGGSKGQSVLYFQKGARVLLENKIQL